MVHPHLKKKKTNLIQVGFTPIGGSPIEVSPIGGKLGPPPFGLPPNGGGLPMVPLKTTTKRSLLFNCKTALNSNIAKNRQIQSVFG